MPKKRQHGDGGLYYIKSRKLWRGVVRLEPDPSTGKRRQKMVHARSQSECRDRLDQLKADIAEYGQVIDRNWTVERWAHHWLLTYKRPLVDPQTFSVYKSAVNKWIVPTIGSRKVGELLPSDITRVHTAMFTAGRATGSVRIVHGVMVMMLDQARKENLCRTNVAPDAPVAARKKKVTKRNAIPTPDALRILEVSLTDDLASMWWFKLLQGQRQNESLGAQLEYLDLVAGEYTVNWSLELLPTEHGCDTKEDGSWECGFNRPNACPRREYRLPRDFEHQHLERQWHLTRPKSAEGRVVPILHEVGILLADYIERHKDEPNPHGLIWRHPNGSPIKPKEEAQMFRDLLHKAGVITADELAPGKSAITGHWARHTTVTVLRSFGVDAQVVGQIVGQSSREITEGYTHPTNDDRAQAIATLRGINLPELPERLAIGN